MSLIHVDNFSIYGGNTAYMLNGRYSTVSANLVNDPDGVSPGQVLQINGAGNIRRALQTPTPKVGISQRIWLNALPSDNGMLPQVVRWSDSSNRPMVFVHVLTTGAMEAYVWDVNVGLGVGYLLGTTTGPVVTANAWWHIEAAFDASALTFELRVEGVTVLTADSSDFASHLNNGPNIYQFQTSATTNNIGAGITSQYKDYVAWDALGSYNNDFLGAVIVTELGPVSDVSIGGWVPSTGTTAYNILAQSPALAPYLSADNSPPAGMQVNLSNLPADVTSVKGLVTIVRAAKTDGGDGSLQTNLLSSGSTAAGANRPITAAQTYWEDFQEVDPHTSSPWTPVSANAATMKITRTT